MNKWVMFLLKLDQSMNGKRLVNLFPNVTFNVHVIYKYQDITLY